MRERMIRVPFDFKDTSSLVKEELSRFLTSSKSKEVEVFVTANVVLVNNNENTYR